MANIKKSQVQTKIISVNGPQLKLAVAENIDNTQKIACYQILHQVVLP